MLEKLFNEFRGFTGGMIITLMMVMLASDKSMGGAEVPGIICFALWMILLGIMRKYSTWGAVLISMGVFFVIDIVKFGVSRAVLIEIGCVVALIAMIYYTKYLS